jgi:predicted AlkP superfamily phosphohydrolase/phosphomutase
MDPRSPVHAAADPRFTDRIRVMYAAMDRALGLALDACDERTILFAVSDHGFAPYRRSFHVNRWLLEEGYLALQPGVDPRRVAFLQGVDWRRTVAYALGINSLYVNLRGRERHGVVHPGRDRDELLAELKGRLESAVDPATGQQPVKHAYRTDQVFSGKVRSGKVTSGDGGDEICDIVLGYRRGWRGSNESALGEVSEDVYGDNTLKWSGDHCMAADEVPGILVCNRPLTAHDPSLVDLGPTFLRLFGREPYPEMIGRPLLG